MINQRILSHFHESAELKIQSASVLARPIEQAVELMFGALSNGCLLYTSDAADE